MGGLTEAASQQSRADMRGQIGAAWGNRTPDLFITSESLCRLS